MYWFSNASMTQQAATYQANQTNMQRIRSCIRSAYNRKELLGFLTPLIEDPTLLKPLHVWQLRELATNAWEELCIEMEKMA